MRKLIRKTNIAAQIFFAFMGTFLVVVILHALFFQTAFTKLYSQKVERDRQTGFEAACDNFSGVNEDSYDISLKEYADDNETAVLVFDDNYNILDTTFFSNMTMFTAEKTDGTYVKIPIKYIKELPDNLRKNSVIVQGMKLGNSSYYVPCNISVNGNTYYQNNEDSVNNKRDVLEFKIQKAWYVIKNGSKATDRTWLIYDALKNCLINQMPIEKYLNSMPAISGEQSEKDGIQYFSYSRESGGKKLYFVTVNTVGLTGSEASYMRVYLLAVYACIFFMLAIAAFIISGRLSKPIKELSQVANKIAKRDFSQRAQIRSNDELGELAANVNIMADNLENAMGEIIESAKEAKENEVRIRTLMANLAHEFKTPLSIISLYSEVIEEGVYEKAPSYYFSIINEQIDSLTKMVDESIQLSNLQAGIWNFSPDNHLLSELVSNALNPFEEQLNRERFYLKIDVPDVYVFADGIRIRQVLTNLISNAIKYSDNNKEITIKAEEKDEKVIVEISNCGKVSQNDIDRIWNRYYRASEQTTTRLPSDGIGLDIVRVILEMHESEYGVRSEESEITFYFSLTKSES